MSSDSNLRTLVFGRNDEPGLVAVEHVESRNGPDEMALFVRESGKTLARREPFLPFLWIASEDLLLGYPGHVTPIALNGRNPLRCLVQCETWKEFQKLQTWLKKTTGRNPSDPSAPLFLVGDPVQQHLLATGRTLFKNLRFGDLRRMQVDIETWSAPEFEFPNADRESDRILVIALADQSGWTELISGHDVDEKALLERFVAVVRERDPDVIEGHNLFKFDIPYLLARAKRHRVKLAIGRDGSVPSSRPSRFVIADRTVAYPRADIFGRHVIDTFFLAQAYDVTHRSLESLGLKDIARHFGVAAPDRTYIDGADIARTFETDPDRVLRYAKDDILETRAVSELLSQSYFAQAQLLPFSYQSICVRGNAAKIDSLLLREYLRRGHSIPQPDAARAFAGGYTDIFFTGVARNVHHCDVRSLYPSILLKDRLRPRTDELDAFLRLLEYLRDLRVDAKRRMQASELPEEKHYLDALQSTFKVLINSFYGYLGFSQARFSDFDAAERVTTEGRDLLKRMIDGIRKHGGTPIEIDTDGIYFLPPERADASRFEAFRNGVRTSLPDGIDVEFDGEYVAMFSYKMKNYALLDEAGEIVVRGAALKSRGLEPFQRNYLLDVLRLKLEGREREISALTATYRKAIEQRSWPVRLLAKTETLQDAPSTYRGKITAGNRGRNAAYELALQSGRDFRAGDQISYYVAGTAKSVAVHSAAKLVSEWDPDRRDENVAYYLAKLDALSRKFDATGTSDGQGLLNLDSGDEPADPAEE